MRQMYAIAFRQPNATYRAPTPLAAIQPQTCTSPPACFIVEFLDDTYLYFFLWMFSFSQKPVQILLPLTKAFLLTIFLLSPHQPSLFFWCTFVRSGFLPATKSVNPYFSRGNLGSSSIFQLQYFVNILEEPSCQMKTCKRRRRS